MQKLILLWSQATLSISSPYLTLTSQVYKLARLATDLILFCDHTTSLRQVSHTTTTRSFRLLITCTLLYQAFGPSLVNSSQLKMSYRQMQDLAWNHVAIPYRSQPPTLPETPEKGTSNEITELMAPMEEDSPAESFEFDPPTEMKHFSCR